MSTFLSPQYVKPAIVVLTSIGVDMLFFGQKNLKNSLMYGAANGIGSFSSNMLINSGMIPNLGSPNSVADSNKMYSVFTVQERILEIGLSIGVGYGLNKYILNNDGAQHDIIKKVGAIVAADVIAEYFTDFLSARPLSYLV